MAMDRQEADKEKFGSTGRQGACDPEAVTVDRFKGQGLGKFQRTVLTLKARSTGPRFIGVCPGTDSSDNHKDVHKDVTLNFRRSAEE
jgi:hypothetical protein